MENDELQEQETKERLAAQAAGEEEQAVEPAEEVSEEENLETVEAGSTTETEEPNA